MFDKHDVTTKKFDAIVEKAGKVDANYAAQIEGYCSLLGEYGKKFEAVCAMLQPEKLRLSPDKYREKLEGINTGYQNAKDTHEQEQSDYEAELYEIETVWYKKMLDKAEDYLIRSAECVVLGNFTDEVTVLGVGVQIVLGIFDLDLPCDIRDIIADIKNLAETDRVRWDLIGMLALDLIGLIPVIGALKYSDETAEAVASGEKLLKESGTIYESFADMMSPEDAKRYLDFLENGSREGLTSAELAGVEKADALLVSQKVEYEDVWDLRNAGDLLESGKYSTQISPEMEKKILEGQRKSPVKNEVIGGHSPQINNSNDLFAVEELSVNADGTRNIKFVKDLQDGSISKIKKSTVFPDSWSDSKIIDTIKEVGDSPFISVRGRDGATWHRKIVDGVEVDVIKLGNDVISGYPTGKINAPKPSGF